MPSTRRSFCAPASGSARAESPSPKEARATLRPAVSVARLCRSRRHRDRRRSHHDRLPEGQRRLVRGDRRLGARLDRGRRGRRARRAHQGGCHRGRWIHRHHRVPAFRRMVDRAREGPASKIPGNDLPTGPIQRAGPARHHERHLPPRAYPGPARSATCRAPHILNRAADSGRRAAHRLQSTSAWRQTTQRDHRLLRVRPASRLAECFLRPERVDQQARH
jgi:hypothetical protein